MSEPYRTGDPVCTCLDTMTAGKPWCPIHDNYAGVPPVAAQVPEPKVFTLVRLGSIEGVMDTLFTGEEAVWVRLAEGIRIEDIVGLEVFARRPA